MTRGKKAFLETLESVFSKLFSMALALTILSLANQKDISKLWEVMIPLGLVGLAISWAIGTKLEDKE